MSENKGGCGKREERKEDLGGRGRKIYEEQRKKGK